MQSLIFVSRCLITAERHDTARPLYLGRDAREQILAAKPASEFIGAADTHWSDRGLRLGGAAPQEIWC
jgi:hypothetical protein